MPTGGKRVCAHGPGGGPRDAGERASRGPYGMWVPEAQQVLIPPPEGEVCLVHAPPGKSQNAASPPIHLPLGRATQSQAPASEMSSGGKGARTKVKRDREARACEPRLPAGAAPTRKSSAFIRRGRCFGLWSRTFLSHLLLEPAFPLPRGHQRIPPL